MFAASFNTIHGRKAEYRMSGYTYGWNTRMVVWLECPKIWNSCVVGMPVCDLIQFIKTYKSFTQTPAMLYLQINTMSKIRLPEEK